MQYKRWECDMYFYNMLSMLSTLVTYTEEVIYHVQIGISS